MQSNSFCYSITDPEKPSLSIITSNTRRFVTVVTFAASLLGFSAVSQAVSLNTMKQNMLNDLNGTVNGYSFVIKKGPFTRTGSGGWAKRPVDIAGGVPMTTNTRSFIASVTKTITAVAILQLLDANNLPITAKIAPWLPNNWVKGPGIAQLTFRDLLQHKTGFKQIFNDLNDAQKSNWGNDWDGLKWIVANGAIPGSSSAYKNANLALPRVIIPKLWKATGNHPGIAWINSFTHGFWYTAYVQQKIFTPSGMAPGASCTASEFYKPQALGYDVLQPNETGSMSETSLANCGGHAGLRLSARDLNKFMYHLHNGNLLTPVWRFVMDFYRLGWSQSSNTDSKGRKDKWWHGGAWNKTSNRGYRACIMKYTSPDNVVASLVINSKTTGKGACTILKEAYNNAL